MEDHTRIKKRPLPTWMKAVCSKSNDGPGLSTSETKKGKFDSEDSQTLSACDIIAQSMPFLSFPGSIIYSYNYYECANLCSDIMTTFKNQEKTAIGFDMEWPVSYKKGDKNLTSLIQMCCGNTCYLFQISAMKSLPKHLTKLILDSRVLLVGLNIESDLWKLARDFDVNVKPIFDNKCVVDISRLANEKLKSNEHWSLEGLCRNRLGQRLDKNSDIRCGDWTEVPLRAEQKTYAAIDAYASLLIYEHLMGADKAMI